MWLIYEKSRRKKDFLQHNIWTVSNGKYSTFYLNEQTSAVSGSDKTPENTPLSITDIFAVNRALNTN